VSISRQTGPARGNSLVAMLTAEGLRLLSAESRVDWLAEGDTLSTAAGPTDHVYFPFESVVSGLSELGDGQSVEAITVGSEGIVGLSLSIYGHDSVLRWEVLVAGDALRVPGPAFRAELARESTFAEGCRRYAGVLAHDVVTTLSCNALHSLSARYARWLLLLSDRLGEDLPVTQERAAAMLGVSRQSVSAVVGDFRREGLIAQARGHIRIVNREGIEDQSCSCYWNLTGRPGGARERIPSRR